MTVSPSAPLLNITVLLMRVLVAVIFASSGWHHLRNPDERSKSIDMSKGFTILLGGAEVLGAAGLVFGVLTAYAALGLTLIMVGAAVKKAVVWRVGFWGDSGSDGWDYELMIILMNLAVIATDGGRYVLLQ
jgi:putative oxidoreductase